VYNKQRIKPDGSAGFTASPWACRGRIFCLSEDGDTYVFQAGDAFKRSRDPAFVRVFLEAGGHGGKSIGNPLEFPQIHA